MTHIQNKWDVVPEGRFGTASWGVFAEQAGEQATNHTVQIGGNHAI